MKYSALWWVILGLFITASGLLTFEIVVGAISVFAGGAALATLWLTAIGTLLTLKHLTTND